MARTTDEFAQRYAPMRVEELRDPLVFVIDMINGFTKEGALHDEAILDIVPALRDVLEKEIGRAVFVADAHPPRTREFQSYPAHCVIGTAESEVIEELSPYVHELFHKNSTNTFICTDFQLFLKERLTQYRDIVITGCCTDICVLQFALCLNAWLNEHNKSDMRIIVPLDCVDTYHIEGMHDCVSSNEFAIRNMEANGILIVKTIKGEH